MASLMFANNMSIVVRADKVSNPKINSCLNEFNE